jgi:hypothetical protein
MKRQQTSFKFSWRGRFVSTKYKQRGGGIYFRIPRQPPARKQKDKGKEKEHVNFVSRVKDVQKECQCFEKERRLLTKAPMKYGDNDRL